MAEQAVIFPNATGEKLVGVWHRPVEKPKAVIVMLHGWSGTRCGPHQMLTRAARLFADNGYAALRFDFSGRGDSEGDTELATLASMQSDTRAAVAQVRQETDAPILFLGLCSGCEIVVAAANDAKSGEQAKAAILWS
ncbi:hypothetical protein EON80_17720, partial [bacterium]